MAGSIFGARFFKILLMVDSAAISSSITYKSLLKSFGRAAGPLIPLGFLPTAFEVPCILIGIL